MNEALTGKEYTVPGNVKKGPVDPYFRIPQYLWTSGLIASLSGPALAMYLVVLSVYRNDQEDYRVWFAQATFKDRFALGESTRKAGLRELVAAGVLTDYTESVDFEGETGNRTYRRKIYRLEAAFQ